jgi:hypothetical protein
VRLAEVPLQGQFFDREGKPTPHTGLTLLRAVAGLLIRSGGILDDYRPLESRTVAQLQALTPRGPAVAFCSDETGGPTIVFYEPAEGEWQRPSDLAAIST